MTILWLSQLSMGLAGPGMGTHLRQNGTLMSASNRLVAFEQQSPIKSTAKQAVSTLYNLGARTELAEQELSACNGGATWCSLRTWGSRMWQWLAGNQRAPMYRWQERGKEEAHELEQDDKGSDVDARKRRLREATIPHIIHQVLTLACCTGPGIFLLFQGMLCLLLAFEGHRSRTSCGDKTSGERILCAMCRYFWMGRQHWKRRRGRRNGPARSFGDSITGDTCHATANAASTRDCSFYLHMS